MEFANSASVDSEADAGAARSSPVAITATQAKVQTNLEMVPFEVRRLNASSGGRGSCRAIESRLRGNVDLPNFQFASLEKKTVAVVRGEVIEILGRLWVVMVYSIVTSKIQYVRWHYHCSN
jgi:hypothetical protein